MNARDLENMLAGYYRGLVGAPLAIDDGGLSREELIAKYARLLEERQFGKPASENARLCD